MTVTGQDALAVVPELTGIYDEPFADASQIPTTLISRLARREVTVALTGDGGDELFCGYTRHHLAGGRLRGVRGWPRPLRTSAAAGLRALSPAAWDGVLSAAGRLGPGLNGRQLHKLAGTLAFEAAGDCSGAAELVPGAALPGDFASGTQLDDAAADVMLGDLETYLSDDLLDPAPIRRLSREAGSEDGRGNVVEGYLGGSASERCAVPATTGSGLKGSRAAP